MWRLKDLYIQIATMEARPWTVNFIDMHSLGQGPATRSPYRFRVLVTSCLLTCSASGHELSRHLAEGTGGESTIRHLNC
jgi:hypothetical protein